jgi:hypothetical protein
VPQPIAGLSERLPPGMDSLEVTVIGSVLNEAPLHLENLFESLVAAGGESRVVLDVNVSGFHEQSPYSGYSIPHLCHLSEIIQQEQLDVFGETTGNGSRRQAEVRLLRTVGWYRLRCGRRRHRNDRI